VICHHRGSQRIPSFGDIIGRSAIGETGDCSYMGSTMSDFSTIVATFSVTLLITKSRSHRQNTRPHNRTLDVLRCLQSIELFVTLIRWAEVLYDSRVETQPKSTQECSRLLCESHGSIIEHAGDAFHKREDRIKSLLASSANW